MSSMSKTRRQSRRAREGSAESGPQASTEGERSGVPVPGWLPPILYGIVTLFLFRKFVFTGEMLFSSDCSESEMTKNTKFSGSSGPATLTTA